MAKICKSVVWYTLLLCKDKYESLNSESGKPAIKSNSALTRYTLYNRQLYYSKANKKLTAALVHDSV